MGQPVLFLDLIVLQVHIMFLSIKELGMDSGDEGR